MPGVTSRCVKIIAFRELCCKAMYQPPKCYCTSPHTTNSYRLTLKIAIEDSTGNTVPLLHNWTYDLIQEMYTYFFEHTRHYMEETLGLCLGRHWCKLACL